MAIEIERKFLVKNNKFNYNRKYKITQGYLVNTKEKCVRIRNTDGFGCFLTIKLNLDEISKYEYEYQIPAEDGIELLKSCSDIIEKTRHLFNNGKHYWEIDKFHGELEGLIIAEIELKSKDEEIQIPDFCSQEVTGDIRYYNSNLLNSKRQNII